MNDPPMPTMIVAPMPIGSGPGMARRPRAPTNKPLITRRMRYVIMATGIPESPGPEPLQHVAGAHDVGEFAVQAGRGGARQVVRADGLPIRTGHVERVRSIDH